jgi:SAM-dependent methyltransferase
MTPAMVSRARANAARVRAENVEFRPGEIEHLPVSDASVDVILSNCVVNLSPDKAAVFREAYRVLRPGGRIAISDVVSTAPIPADLRGKLEAYTGCIAGAALLGDIERMLREAGFSEVRVAIRGDLSSCIADWMPGTGAENVVASATIEGRKPGGERSCCGPSCCTPGAST